MKLLIFPLLLFVTCSTIAQEFKFGRVGTSILEETQDSIFLNIPAKVVYRYINFNYDNELEIHERVKIYNEDGFEFSNWEVPFSEITYLQGYTYNLENGIVKKSHVKKENIFKEQISNDYEITKISFPKVKKGSVIELKYKVKRVRASEIPIQYVIPVKNFRLAIGNVKSWMEFKQNPNLNLKLEEEPTDNDRLKVFTAKNIPSGKDEPYVDNLDNYRGKLFIKSKSDKTDEEKWAGIAADFNASTYLGRQLIEKPFFIKDILPLIKDKRDTLATAKSIYSFVQQHMEYNQVYTRGTYEIEKMYKGRKGGKGEINLVLTSMLRYMGYNANPMMIACKHQGQMLFPEKNMFNVALCALQIGKDFYLLDASEKYAKFGVIPADLMSDMGLIVFEDGRSISYPTRDAVQSVNNTIVTTRLNIDDYSAFGSVNNQWTNNLALEYRKAAETAEEASFKEALEALHPLLTIENLEDKHRGDPEESVKFSYDFQYKDAVEDIGSNLYVSPFLFLGSTTNDFDDDNRLYPIDLEYPKKETFTVTFHIPEGYSLESVPKNKKITLQDNLGNLIFIAKQQGSLLQLRLSVQINFSLIPASYYGALKELFKEYLSISKSKIVLSKL